MRTVQTYKLLNYTVNYHINLIEDSLLRSKQEVVMYFYYAILNLVSGYYNNNYISYDAYRYFRSRIMQIIKGA